MKLKTSIVKISNIPFHVTEPASGLVTKAILLFPEAHGTTGHISDVACRFARLGYKVFLYQLYYIQGKDVKFHLDPNDKETRDSLLQNICPNTMIADLRKTKDYFSQFEHFSIVGFSIGGYFSILASSVLNPQSVIAFYPNPTPNNFNYPFPVVTEYIPLIPKNSLLLFGENDHSIPASEVELVRTLAPQCKVVSYPKSQHGFFCNSRHTYNKNSAKDAWDRILKILA